MPRLSWTTRLTVAALITLMAAACGGDDSSGLATLQGVTTTAPDETITAAGAEEPTSEVGVARDGEETATSGAVGDTGTDDTAADHSTGDVTRDGETASAGDADDLTDEERLLEFAQCMRDEGVDISDPDPTVFGPGSGGGRPFGGLDFDDADVSAAFEVCGDRLPARPGRGGGQ